MPSVQQTAPRSNTRGDSLADILERVLDTGIVIAGDIRVQLADIELLTIQIRLIICSVDKAQQLGMDWWKGASFLTSDALPTAEQAAQGQQGQQAQLAEPAARAAQRPAAEPSRSLGAEQPGTVADIQGHFDAPAQQRAPAWTDPGEHQPWKPNQPAGQPQSAPTWNTPTQPPQAQRQAPVAPREQPMRSAPPAQAPTGISDVQAEMLNERLARLEAVLERLIPPEDS